MTCSPSRTLGWTLLLATLLAIPLPAQADEEPWGLELAFDHGLSLASHPGSDMRLVSGRLGLDARLHSPSGFGAAIRLGAFPAPIPPLNALEIDVGASYRGWLVRSGPRGVQLGGALGVSWVVWSGNPQRPGIVGLACAPDGMGGCRDPHDERFGPFGEVHLDYREHSLLLGVAVLARWLPADMASEDARLGFAWVSVLARVGGEIEL